MRNDPQTPNIDNKQRTEGSRTDVEREKLQQREQTDLDANARKLKDTEKGSIGKDKLPNS